MTAPHPRHLDRELILRAFRIMAEDLHGSGMRGEILVAGGAAMALEHDARRATQDVDGLILQGHGAVTAAAHRAADELHLERGWLNEGVSVYLSTVDTDRRPPVFDHPALTVSSVTTEHLFALKARASRAQDIGDLRVLATELGLHDAAAALLIVARLFPDDPLSDRARLVICDLFD